MKYLACVLLLLVAASHLKAQTQKPPAFELGVVETLYSNTLSENRTLNIYLPEGYDTALTTHYPVIYLLDGSTNEDFIHVAGLVQYLSMYEMMPKSIVVGIANVDRKRDYTFPTKNDEDKKLVPNSGSSAKFIEFIGNELQPFIESTYRTNEHRTIIGQSLGGLLASEILMQHPAMFNDYMIISPSLWWNKESLLDVKPVLWRARLSKEIRAYIAVGKEGDMMERPAKKLVDILKESGNVKTYFQYMPDENHLTILHNALYKGFVMMNGSTTNPE
jgi:predicted alpha/beta superfamily hydrolase